jgi:hypothetical protein
MSSTSVSSGFAHWFTGDKAIRKARHGSRRARAGWALAIPSNSPLSTVRAIPRGFDASNARLTRWSPLVDATPSDISLLS